MEGGQRQSGDRPAGRFRDPGRVLPARPITGCSSTTDGKYILTLNGTGIAYLYDAVSDTYVAQRQLLTGADSGLLRRARRGTRRLLFPDGRPDSEFRSDRDRRLGAARRAEHHNHPGVPGRPGSPGGGGVTVTVVNTGQRNVAALAAAQRLRFPAPDHAGAPDHHHGHPRRFADDPRNDQPDHRRRPR